MISNILEAPLAPVADLDDAEEAVRPVARSMVRLLGVTVRAQFPDAAYLVLQRSTEDEEVYLVAVRNAEGMDLWDFPTDTPACYRPFPSPVPPELAELWGDLDPQRPDSIESLAQRIDAVLGIDVVPKSAMHPGEEKMERTPLGIPLLDAEVPEWPITWPRFVATVERLRAEGRALARLIADTLNRQFDGAAAYLVLEESDSRDFMGMQSIHDGDGERCSSSATTTQAFPRFLTTPRWQLPGDTWTRLTPGRLRGRSSSCTGWDLPSTGRRTTSPATTRRPRSSAFSFPRPPAPAGGA